MKQYVSILIIFAFFLMAIPSISLLKKSDTIPENNTEPLANSSNTVNDVTTPTAEYDKDVFLVLDTANGQVSKLSARDYVIGAVCAEMPASFNPEALKAQAVAAHTYAVRQREKELATPTAELKGAYFSNDPAKFQAFFTTDQAKQFYGADYDANYKKVSEAVDSVLKEILVYKNEPIVAAFHSMSGGTTESSAVVWGNAVDYLVPVDSAEDITAPNYLDVKNFTPDELSARLKTTYSDIKLGDDKTAWLTITERSTSGTITSLKAGDKVLTGMEFRTLLSLRSANFEIKYDGSNFEITTKGYGHGVGLSQYGANAMAGEGKTYKEILTHYYKGVDIIEE